MTVYFTKLKALYEELNNFKPSCSCGKCTCGGLKDLNAYFQMEYVMTFLMGLNDSFAQIRGQLLLLDPIPPINKVFSIVSQEERHRSVSVQATSNVIDPANNMAFAVRSEGVKKNSPDAYKSGNYNAGNYKGQKKERPFCTHCNYPGHTVEKCYKLHGYPPGYKSNAARSKSTNTAVAQVSNSDDSS